MGQFAAVVSDAFKEILINKVKERVLDFKNPVKNVKKRVKDQAKRKFDVKDRAKRAGENIKEKAQRPATLANRARSVLGGSKGQKSQQDPNKQRINEGFLPEMLSELRFEPPPSQGLSQGGEGDFNQILKLLEDLQKRKF